MKSVLPVLAAVLACLAPVPAGAAAPADPEIAARLRAAMKSARWTGSMLSSNAETLPQGHFYTEPYLFDVMSGGDHHPGTSGFYQYGLFDNLTVGVEPNISFGTQRFGRQTALGDFKILSQLRLTHFTPDHRVPTISLSLNEVIPTGKDDNLGPNERGHGSGTFGTEVGINVQHYFLFKNARLLRARINLLKSFPYGTDITGRSVYGTEVGFRGHAKPGSRNTLIAAVEYSVTREWVVAFDVITSPRARRVSGEGTQTDCPSIRAFQKPGTPVLRLPSNIIGATGRASSWACGSAPRGTTRARR